jgi:acyl-CoA synthetase (AMP-forming)/AMP-acid ligase II
MLQTILPEAASRHGDKVALVTSSRSLSYRELDDLSVAFAGALRACGIVDGDRVSIYSQNRWEWVVAYHGILKAGAVVNPINVMLTPEEVAFVLIDCGARAIVTSGDKAQAVVDLRDRASCVETVVAFDRGTPGTRSFLELLDSAAPIEQPAGPAPESLSTIGYTSGTTGHPKGAMQSHLAVFLNCALTATMHVRTSNDTVVTALPAPHVYGNVVINSIFMAGGTVVLMGSDEAEQGAVLCRLRACSTLRHANHGCRVPEAAPWPCPTAAQARPRRSRCPGGGTGGAGGVPWLRGTPSAAAPVCRPVRLQRRRAGDDRPGACRPRRPQRTPGQRSVARGSRMAACRRRRCDPLRSCARWGSTGLDPHVPPART